MLILTKILVYVWILVTDTTAQDDLVGEDLGGDVEIDMDTFTGEVDRERMDRREGEGGQWKEEKSFTEQSVLALQQLGVVIGQLILNIVLHVSDNISFTRSCVLGWHLVPCPGHGGEDVEEAGGDLSSMQGRNSGARGRSCCSCWHF